MSKEGQRVGQTGFLHKLTPEEKQKLEQIKTTFANYEQSELELNVGSFALDDYLFLRYLRARKFVVKDAEKMLRNTLEFRRKYDPVNIRPIDIKDAFVAGAWNWLGFSKDGRSVLLFDASRWDPTKVKDIETYTRLLLYWTEIATMMMKQCGNEREKQFVLFDMSGWTFWHHGGPWPLKLTGALVNLTQSHLPERLEKAILFNAPGAFSGAWKAIKGLLDPDTAAKVCFTSDKKELLKFFDSSLLPERLGGTRKGTIPMIGEESLMVRDSRVVKPPRNQIVQEGEQKDIDDV